MSSSAVLKNTAGHASRIRLPDPKLCMNLISFISQHIYNGRFAIRNDRFGIR